MGSSPSRRASGCHKSRVAARFADRVEAVRARSGSCVAYTAQATAVCGM
jgi:hypothetical protein